MALHEVYLAAIIVIILIIVALNIYVWSQRQSRGVLYYFVTNIFSIGLCASYYIVTVTDSHEIGYLWLRFRVIFLTLTPVCALLFVTRFVRRPWWFNRYTEAVFWCIPIILLTAQFIPALSSYFFEHWSLIRLEGYSVEYRSFGVLYNVLLAYQFVVSAIVFYILLDYGLRVDSAWRRSVWFGVPPLILMIVISNLPIALGPPPGMRVAPLLIGVGAIGVGLTFLRYNTLKILPVAYDHILESVQDGVVVVQDGVIVRVNPAAEHLIGQFDLLTRRLVDVLPLPLPQQTTQPFEFTHREIVLAAEVLPLYQHQKVVGQTLILRDITAQKQAAQEALALAAERERSRLITDFLVKLSDDFRAPMDVLTDLTPMLYAEEPQDRARAIAQIESHIDAMTGQVLTLRKLIDEPLPAPSKYVDVSEKVTPI